MLDFLKATFHRLIADLSISTYRYLYFQFNINSRLTGLVGPRGTGKTTLLLQYIKNNLYTSGKVFYFSADNIYFNNNSLLEFIANLYQLEGINIFFIDEVHKYANWYQELKNIYDAFPEIKIIFSGSSSIDLIKGSYDLSRRAKLFKMAGLSLREYLNFTTEADIQAVTFDDLKTNYRKYDNSFSQIPRIKGIFKKYLTLGYYPFVFEDENSYHEKVLRTIDKTIYEDITNYYNLKTANLSYFKRILNFLATSMPGNISINNLAHNLGIDHKTAENYLNILAESGLVRLVYAEATGNQVLRKPEKAFLHNTTLMHVLRSCMSSADTLGTMRELFFVQSTVDAGLSTFYCSSGDFAIDNVVFEIGGKNKTKKQLQNVAKNSALLVKDDILTSAQTTVPLYYFGFLY